MFLNTKAAILNYFGVFSKFPWTSRDTHENFPDCIELYKHGVFEVSANQRHAYFQKAIS